MGVTMLFQRLSLGFSDYINAGRPDYFIFQTYYLDHFISQSECPDFFYFLVSFLYIILLFYFFNIFWKLTRFQTPVPRSHTINYGN